MKGILGRLLSKPPQKSFDSFDIATEDDLYYCYRLFLRRAPDSEGLASYRKLTSKGYLSLRTLTEGFLHSKEFLSLQADTPLAAMLSAAHQIQLVDVKNFKMFVRGSDLFIGRPLSLGQDYEPSLAQRIVSCLKPDAVFVDVGANIGYFSLLIASRLGDQGKVIAFEPNFDNCELLKLSIKVNGLKNIQLYPYAVADREEEFLLETDGSNGWIRPVQSQPNAGAQLSAGDQNGEGAGERRLLVKSVVLDHVLRDIQRIDAIKMDIEGAEPRALRGMNALIQKHRPIIFTEFSPGMISAISQAQPEDYLAALHELDYDIFIVGDDTTRSSPQSSVQVMERFARVQVNHIDLVAYPK